MASTHEGDILGQTLVSFSRDGQFPEEDEVSAMPVSSSALPIALDILSSAKSELESEIRTISRDSAPHVDAWIKNATALQDDIERSRKLANEIVREAEAGESKNKAAKEAEERVEFLSKETLYNNRIRIVLLGFKSICNFLDEAENLAAEKKLVKALHRLAGAWEAIDKLPGHHSTRAVQLLNDRAFGLRQSIHEQFNHIWDSLVIVGNDMITVRNDLEVDPMDIETAITIMKAYKELDDRVDTFAATINDKIIAPRINLNDSEPLSIVVEGDTIRVEKPVENDLSVKSLLKELEAAFKFLKEHLPAEFITALSKKMIPRLCRQIQNSWLDSAVPSSLEDMEAFRKAIALVQTFARNLDSMGWNNTRDLHDWVSNSPKTWLTKRRETSLDDVRISLSSGLGTPKRVIRVETQTVSHKEGKQIGANSDASNDWDAAWSDEEDDAASKGQIRRPEAQENRQGLPENSPAAPDDDAADAWGWNDEDPVGDEAGVDAPDGKLALADKLAKTERTVTLTESYSISSMPGPVLATIKSILEDGASLTQEKNERNPVAPAAVGLFALPTLILAMYRAVSPYYYSLEHVGNMYLYNDALWLAEQLRDYTAEWGRREDLNPRMHGKVKLDNEILVMEKFGKRGYASEMSTQRTVLTDLLGGAQNFLQQDGQEHDDDEIAIDSVTSHIRRLASDWKGVLTKSAWAQATGSLLSTVARKIIYDIEDLPSLGQDEAYRMASLIATIVELDDLFLPDDKNLPQIPQTAQYASDWLKLQHLSQILQSDLKDLKYLWFESELSLFFTVEELIGLMQLSFENNYRYRDLVSEIKKNPHPRANAEDEW